MAEFNMDVRVDRRLDNGSVGLYFDLQWDLCGRLYITFIKYSFKNTSSLINVTVDLWSGLIVHD
jgi:hypothetical protein